MAKLRLDTRTHLREHFADGPADVFVDRQSVERSEPLVDVDIP
jgi:hypothetical protein